MSAVAYVRIYSVRNELGEVVSKWTFKGSAILEARQLTKNSGKKHSFTHRLVEVPVINGIPWISSAL